MNDQVKITYLRTKKKPPSSPSVEMLDLVSPSSNIKLETVNFKVNEG